MKLGAVFCIYNEPEYIEYAVNSILPAVDKVFIVLGKAPYTAYNPKARDLSKADTQTETIVDRLAKEHPEKIQVTKGIWDNELDERDTGLQMCLDAGMDYFWLVDGDEVYRADHIENIKRGIAQRPNHGTFIVKCETFWRSFNYRIPAQQNSWRPRRIFKLTKWRRLLGIPIFPNRLRFKGINDITSVGPIYEFPPEEAVFYHFSYARSSKAMDEKFVTFSHAHQILPEWVEKVWKPWPTNREMENIHPVDPPKFPKALQIPPNDFPEILKSHPYYGLDLIP